MGSASRPRGLFFRRPHSPPSRCCSKASEANVFSSLPALPLTSSCENSTLLVCASRKWMVPALYFREGVVT